MADSFEQMLREVFGESFSRWTDFQKEQVRKLTGKLHEVAREALRDELDRMDHQLAELRERVTVLETKRATQAAEVLESSSDRRARTGSPA